MGRGKFSRLTLSDGPQEDASIKSAKGATVEQMLHAGMDLDEDPDVILPEDQLEEAVNAIDQILSR